MRTVLPLLASATASQAGPLQKVVDLLTELHGKAAKDAEKDTKLFNDYACESKQTIKDLQTDIAELASKLTQANADIGSQKAIVKQAHEDIKQNNKDLATLQKKMKKNDAEWAILKEDLTAEIADFNDAKGDAKQAIKILRSNKSRQVKTTDTFLQEVSKMHKAVGDIVRNEATKGSVHHSSKVITMLEKCYNNFTTLAQNSTQTLVDEEQKYNTQKAEDQQSVADYKQTLEEDNNILKTADAKMSEFQAAATHLTANRMAKTQELQDEIELSGQRNSNFNDRYESRNDELQAITTAKAILLHSATEMDKSVAGKRANFKGLVQISKAKDEQEDRDDDVELSEADFPAQDEAPEDVQAPSFLQMRMIPSAALNVLRQLAAKQPQTEFAQLVSGLSTRNPFAEVIGLIEELITKKNEQIARSASKAQMCDQEMTNIKENKAIAQKKFEEFQDEALTQATKFDENQALFKKAVADLAEADKIFKDHTIERIKKYKYNSKQFTDAQIGYNATVRAINTLADYYNKKPELLQTAADPLDEKSYGGAQGSASGIFGLLEVVASDFEKTYHKMQEDEKAQEEEYMLIGRDHQKETMELRTLKDEYKRLFKKAESDHTEAVDAFQGQVEEWGKALKAWQSIKKTCFDTGVPFEVREAKRQSEIDALKEALATLEEYK